MWQVVKSSLNRDSNPGHLAYRASALPTELLRPDILTDSHTPGYPVAYSPFLRILLEYEKCMKHMLREYCIVGIYIGRQNVTGLKSQLSTGTQT